MNMKRTFSKLLGVMLIMLGFLIFMPAGMKQAQAAGWNYNEAIRNFKVSPSSVSADANGKAKVEVSFDLAELPSGGSAYSEYGIFMTNGDSYEVRDYSGWPNVSFYGYRLKETGNRYTLEFQCDEKETVFTVAFADFCTLYDSNGTPYESPVIKDTFTFVNGNESNTTDFWDMGEMVSDMKLVKNEFTLGTAQNLVVTFKNKAVPSTPYYQSIDFVVLDSEGNEVTSKSVYSFELQTGVNNIEIPCRIEQRGQYSVKVSEGVYTNFATLPFTVKKAVDAGGNAVDVSNTVMPQYPVYSRSQGNNLKVNYSVSDISCDYHLYVMEGVSEDYESDRKHILTGADFMSSLGEMPLKLGETCTMDITTGFNGFGCYSVVLYNTTTKRKVAQEQFYVVPEEYLIQRDMSTMTDTGLVPLSVTADKRNLSLDKNAKINMEVAFPIDYSEYLEEFKLKYYYDDDADDFDIDGAFFTDSYYAEMTVKYRPEYSDDTRILFKKRITGMYRTHKLSLSSEELKQAIFETCGADVGYAGVVTVEFSNESGDAAYQTIANDAIVRFTDSFSFGVSQSEKLKSAKAVAAKVDRAYGESADFTVTDTLGGKIFATIYKGSKKICTVEGKCSLNEDGTATGIVSWNLKNAKGKYAAKGQYKAKIYTLNEYTVYDNNGKADTKTVKSAVKTVKFTLKKPSAAFTLNASAIGSDGGSSVYVEDALIGIESGFNIGAKVTVRIKNASGNVLKTFSYVRGKGDYTYWCDLSGLGSKLSAGNYKAEVTAKTLDGAEKTANVSFTVKKMPKPSIEGASVSVDNSCGSADFSFKVTQSCDVSVTVRSGSKTLQTAVNQHYSAGTVKGSFSVGGLAAGSYNVIITAGNSGGTSTVTKTFEIKAKPVIVKKPTIGSLNIRYGTGRDGDTVKASFNYTGKNSKVVVDVMYDDLEEIVYTCEGITGNDSGNFTFTWDCFKSNGFKARTGNYTMRVYLVNSAGKTEYVRKAFKISEG